MIDTSSEVRALLMHYNRLLELHSHLEPISKEVCEAMGDLSQFDTVQTKLNEKMAIVESIQKESQEITAKKKKLKLSDPEKAEIRKAEEKLTIVVKRIIEQENRSCELLQKQGVKILRK